MKKIINSHYFKLIISSMFAGLIMALAGFELVVANKESLNLFYVGGFVQGFGLLTILFLGLDLFNCKLVGLFESKNKIKYAIDLLIVLLTNILTIFLVAYLLRVLTNGNEELRTSAVNIANMRVIIIGQSEGKEWYDALIASLMCGFIIAISINVYKRTNNAFIKLISIIAGVGIYVACGFEQIMTNIFYVVFADMLNGSTILDLFIVLIGNSVAAILVYFGFKLILPNTKKVEKHE